MYESFFYENMTSFVPLSLYSFGEINYVAITCKALNIMITNSSDVGSGLHCFCNRFGCRMID